MPEHVLDCAINSLHSMRGPFLTEIKLEDNLHRRTNTTQDYYHVASVLSVTDRYREQYIGCEKISHINQVEQVRGPAAIRPDIYGPSRSGCLRT